MRKISLLFVVVVLVVTSSCKKDDTIQQPKNLITRDKMVDIIYDLSLLEAVKGQNFGIEKYPRATEFVQRKYKIDSLTFAQSSEYYASDMKEYKKMYEEIKQRLDKEGAKLNGGKAIEQNNTGGGVVK